MSSIAEQISAKWKQRLAAITTANGYASDIGTRIFEGWLSTALVDDKQTEYPFLLIQPLTDKRRDKSAGGRVRLALSHQILAVEKVGADVVPKLMQHLQDMRLALTDRSNTVQLDGLSLHTEVGDADYQIPEDGYAVAWVSLTVSADYDLTITT